MRVRQQYCTNGANAVAWKVDDGVGIEGLSAVDQDGAVLLVLSVATDNSSSRASSAILAGRIASGVPRRLHNLQSRAW